MEKNEALEQMLKAPQSENQDPLVHDEESEEMLDEEKELEAHDIVSMTINNKTTSEKYIADLIEIAKKDPESVMVETPQGMIPYAEAIRLGYNPETGEFDKGVIKDPELDEEGLTPEQVAQLKQMFGQQGGDPGMMDPGMMDPNMMQDPGMMQEPMLPGGEEELLTPEEGMMDDPLGGLM